MKRVTIAAVAAFAVATACGAADGADSLDVTLDEWQIGLSNTHYRDGAVELNVTNAGEFPHTLVVEGPDGEILAATDVIAPGGDASLQLELEQVAFRFTCRIVATTRDGALVDHFAAGMAASVASAGPLTSSRE
jgi:hypothetical protein